MTVPEKRFSSGGIVVAVWANQGKTKEGEDTTFQTISLQRRYKDKDGEWKSTDSLRVSDLPKAALLLGKTYEHLVKKPERQ